MSDKLTLASGSEIRADLLRNADVEFTVHPVRVDEEMILASLVSEGVAPDEVADALAEAKARKGSMKAPGHLVLGCDQILEIEGAILQKPKNVNDAVAQLTRLRGKTHRLYSAAVIYQDGKPLWRFTGTVRLSMRTLSDEFIADYVSENWQDIRHSVGCYQYEGAGAVLFSRVEGDYFHVLGLPLLEILDYLIVRGILKI